MVSIEETEEALFNYTMYVHLNDDYLLMLKLEQFLLFWLFLEYRGSISFPVSSRLHNCDPTIFVRLSIRFAPSDGDHTVILII